jgi:hypothetical protein
MSAIITDQLRILNAKNFVAGIASTTNSYYTFVGLPNATNIQSNWNTNPPAPKDSFNEENSYWDTAITFRRIFKGDARQVIRRIAWRSGITYDMYRHDISRTNPAKSSGATNLYSSNYYVMNSDYRVYICLKNGSTPENPSGRPSLDEPTFTDLEPRAAGTSGDGYIWKYLYTIRPSDIVKFDSTNFIPVPQDWETSSENEIVRNNATTSGQIKIVTVENRGVGLGTANRTYSRVPIRGDGSGAEATIVINSESKVETITVSSGGSGYTYGTVDLVGGGVPTGSTSPIFNVIIPPQGGHGYDIYRELGAYNVLIYSRYDSNLESDLVIGNEFARIGIVENPKAYDSNEVLTSDTASGVGALMLKGDGYNTVTIAADTFITQTVGLGSTAVGRVISYDNSTGLLKYWQDRTLVGFNSDGSLNTSPSYGFTLQKFTANPTSGGSITINTSAAPLVIDTNFGTLSNPGVSTVINSRTYYLGQQFISGVSNPEVKKYSGNIIYVDNRPSVTRSTNQKEDIKVILQF